MACNSNRGRQSIGKDMVANKSIQQKCTRCKKIMKTRQFLICGVCENPFHVECTEVSIKRFFLMTKDNKQKWKCNKCHRPNYARQESTPKAIIKGDIQPTSSTNDNSRLYISIPTENSFETLTDTDAQSRE